MVNNVVFLVNKSEITAGTRGSSLGPEAIIAAARRHGNYMFGQNKTQFLRDVNYYLDAPTNYPFAKYIDGTLEIYNELNKEVSNLLINKAYPVILSGDHGSAGGTIAGIKTAFPFKRLGVVWIDAHADIHTPYTSPSGNIHGMPLATALAVDNLESKKRDVDAETISMWNKLKNVGGIAPKINPEDIVYVAVRDIETEEIAIMDRLGIHNISVDDLREKGMDSIIETINDRLKDCDIIYVSFDVDSMCPSLSSYGTGTPVDDGMSPQEAQDMLVALAKNPKVICYEIVEVNPCLDEKFNSMAEIALNIIEAVINIIKT
jgi:arginase